MRPTDSNAVLNVTGELRFDIPHLRRQVVEFDGVGLLAFQWPCKDSDDLVSPGCWVRQSQAIERRVIQPSDGRC